MKPIHFEKIVTRDVPLIGVECWYEGHINETAKVFNTVAPESLFILRNGTVESYRDTNKMDEVQELLVHYVKEHPDLVPHAVSIHKNAIALSKEIISTHTWTVNTVLERLALLRTKFISGFPGLFLFYLIPVWQEESHKKGIDLFEQNIVDACQHVRDTMDGFFGGSIEAFYFLIKTIAQLKEWDPALLKFITYNELLTALETNTLPIQELEKRRNEPFAYTNNCIIFDLTTLSADGYMFEQDPDIKNISTITGTVAFQGNVTGKIKRIFSREDVAYIKEGDILVSPMTSPTYMEAISKSAGIITDEGGITCHAAIIARELKKPCIIGTKIATKVLKDGDMVEINADEGTATVVE